MALRLRPRIGDPLGFPSYDDGSPPRARGWVHLAPVQALRRNGVTNLRRFGRDVVVFATSTGEIRATESVCPHLGAHLGGAQVVDDCLRCPFHFWRFGPDGQVAHVPNAARLPLRARLDLIPVTVVGGIAFMYQWAPGEDALDELPPFDRDVAMALDEPDGWIRSHRMRDVDLAIADVARQLVRAEPLGELRLERLETGDDVPVVVGVGAGGADARVGPRRAASPTRPGSVPVGYRLAGQLLGVEYRYVILLAPREEDRTAALAAVRTPAGGFGAGPVANAANAAIARAMGVVLGRLG